MWIDYKCNKCGTKQTLKIGMTEERPKEVDCIKKGCDGKATFMFSQLKESRTIIKDHMRATGGSSMNYTKMDRKLKKFK